MKNSIKKATAKTAFDFTNDSILARRTKGISTAPPIDDYVKLPVTMFGSAPLMTSAPAAAAAGTPDLSVATYWKFTANAAFTVNAPTNAVLGQIVVVEIIQDSGGGRAVTWNGAFVFATAWSDTGNTASKRSFATFIVENATGPVLRQIALQTAYAT